jgi:hypothetical protein
MRVVHSELTRLGSPSPLLGGIGLMTCFGLLATVVVFTTAGSGSATLPGTEDITVAMLEAPDGMFTGLQTFAGIASRRRGARYPLAGSRSVSVSAAPGGPAVGNPLPPGTLPTSGCRPQSEGAPC